MASCCALLSLPAIASVMPSSAKRTASSLARPTLWTLDLAFVPLHEALRSSLEDGVHPNVSGGAAPLLSCVSHTRVSSRGASTCCKRRQRLYLGHLQAVATQGLMVEGMVEEEAQSCSSTRWRPP